MRRSGRTSRWAGRCRWRTRPSRPSGRQPTWCTRPQASRLPGEQSGLSLNVVARVLPSRLAAPWSLTSVPSRLHTKLAVFFMCEVTRKSLHNSVALCGSLYKFLTAAGTHRFFFCC